MKNYLRNIYWFILKILPINIVIQIENLFTYKRFFKNDRAEYFGEKIQWLKLYGNLEKYTNYVDKYKVRDYIKKKIGDDYLIPLLGVYDKVEDIPYNDLPAKFVIKGNHGSGYNLIIKEKEKTDFNKIKRILNKWLNEDYSKIKKENQYSHVQRKIIIEQYMSDKNDELIDYKFFCFNGKPEFVKVDFDRYTNHKANFYDMNWKLLDIKEKGYDNFEGEVSKPEEFEKMIEISKKLCEDFSFVRVDLYNLDGKIFFGELTFSSFFVELNIFILFYSFFLFYLN